MTRGAYNIPEPPADAPLCVPDAHTLCILPGLSFDLEGNRLGYGKGYYDRYMVRFTGVSAGICYSNELKPFLYHGRYDRHVDVVVTDKRIKTCNK